MEAISRSLQRSLIEFNPLSGPFKDIHRVVPEVPSALESPCEFFQSHAHLVRRGFCLTRKTQTGGAAVMVDPLESSPFLSHDH